MANMATASGVYQQMVVPAPYHYHQPQCQLVPTICNHNPLEIKKETKKRKKVVDKSNSDKKKTRLAGQTAYVPGGIRVDPEATEKGPKFEACPVCNKKKCFKHLDAKNKAQTSKKTPEDVVIQMKKHMLKLLTNQDFTTFCKIDPKNNQVDIDITKMHHSYLEEHEPQAAEALSSQDNTKDKPKVKKWLYRKIFLDEFKTFEYNSCKRHLGELRRSIDTVIQQKKKKVQKPKNPPPPAQNQMIPQDYSLNNHNLANGAPADMTRSGLPPSVVGPGHNSAVATPAGYQPNLMSIGVDTNATPVSSMAMAGGTPTLHNSLATYMTQQVPPNLLFGLGQQQQPPPPAQQQPLNLQTSHQSPMQPGHQPGHQPPGTATAPGVPVPHSAPAPPLPLNLHNHPYYVSFGPMLPLHMSTPQHNHQQQFQQNIMQQQGAQGGFNQHAMYQ